MYLLHSSVSILGSISRYTFIVPCYLGSCIHGELTFRFCFLWRDWKRYGSRAHLVTGRHSRRSRYRPERFVVCSVWTENNRRRHVVSSSYSRPGHVWRSTVALHCSHCELCRVVEMVLLLLLDRTFAALRSDVTRLHCCRWLSERFHLLLLSCGTQEIEWGIRFRAEISTFLACFLPVVCGPGRSVDLPLLGPTQC